MSDKQDEEPKLVTLNSFGRRTWNKEAYADLARRKRLAKNQPEDNLAKKNITQRTVDVDFYKNINKVQLVEQSSSVSVHRGKSSGFYCDLCNLTFRDNLSFLNHLNSSQHLEKSEYQTKNLNINISAEDVRKRIEQVYQRKLREKEEKSDLEVYDLKKRIAKREKFEKEEAARKRQKRKEKKNKTLREEEKNDDNDDMSKIMGFAAFGSTKM